MKAARAHIIVCLYFFSINVRTQDKITFTLLTKCIDKNTIKRLTELSCLESCFKFSKVVFQNDDRLHTSTSGSKIHIFFIYERRIENIPLPFASNVFLRFDNVDNCKQPESIRKVFFSFLYFS